MCSRPSSTQIRVRGEHGRGLDVAAVDIVSEILPVKPVGVVGKTKPGASGDNHLMIDAQIARDDVQDGGIAAMTVQQNQSFDACLGNTRTHLAKRRHQRVGGQGERSRMAAMFAAFGHSQCWQDQDVLIRAQ